MCWDSSGRHCSISVNSFRFHDALGMFEAGPGHVEMTPGKDTKRTLLMTACYTNVTPNVKKHLFQQKIGRHKISGNPLFIRISAQATFETRTRDLLTTNGNFLIYHCLPLCAETLILLGFCAFSVYLHSPLYAPRVTLMLHQCYTKLSECFP